MNDFSPALPVVLAANRQVRHTMVDLLAPVLAYLPAERPVLPPHGLGLRWRFRGQGGINTDQLRPAR